MRIYSKEFPSRSITAVVKTFGKSLSTTIFIVFALYEEQYSKSFNCNQELDFHVRESRTSKHMLHSPVHLESKCRLCLNHEPMK